MFRASVLAVVFIASPLLGVAHAAVLPSSTELVGNCTAVSNSPDLADPANGICVSAARQFADKLPNPADAAGLAALVTTLAELPRPTGKLCGKFADEIAAAINVLAAAQSGDPTQAAAFTEIAATVVDDCGDLGTASLLEGIDPGVDQNEGTAQ